MKLRSFLYGLAVSVVVLLLIGAGGFFWLTANSPLTLLRGSDKVSPVAAMFVPKQAPAMLSLLVNPDRLESFRLAVTPPGERRKARAELNQLRQNFLANTRLDYRQDVQPWLGDEITLAVTTPDLDRDRTNGLQPGYLLAVATQDPERSREFLQLFWQRQAIAGTDLVFEQYAGVKLIYGSPAKTVSTPESESDLPITLSSAVVGDRFVLFANSPKVLREAITNVQAPDLSLSNSSAYQAAVRRLPTRQIGLTFVNLPQLTTWLADQSGAGDPVEPSDLSLKYASGSYESLIMGLELTRAGLFADTSLLAAAGKKLDPAKPALTKPVDALQFIPAGSPLTAAGTDLQQLWSQMQDELSDYETLATLVQQPLADLERQWNIDLKEDVFSWVQGDYALAMLPRSDRKQPDWVFVAEQSPAAEAGIERLDAIAKQQGLSVGPLMLDDQQIYAWTRLSANARDAKSSDSGLLALQAEVKGVHATVDQYEIFTTSIAAMNQALAAPQMPLVKTADFQEAIAPLNSTNNGYLYIDWLAVRELVEQRIPAVRLVELSAQPLFKHLRSVTLSSYGTEANVRRGGIFLRLKES